MSRTACSIADKEYTKGMEPIFDHALLRQRRKRFLKNAQKAGFLHEETAQHLIEDLSLIQRCFKNILVLGAHGDALDKGLKKLYPLSAIAHLDFTTEDNDPSADLIPFAPQSFDLILSNLDLHLRNDVPGVLAQIQKSLVPDGMFLAAMLGGESLGELRQVATEVDAEIFSGAGARIIPLPEFAASAALLQRAGFALPVAHHETIDISFQDFFELLQKIRHNGLANFMIKRAKKPLTRKWLMRAAELYHARHGEKDRVTASAQIIYLSGWHPAENQQKPLARGSGKVNLADVL